MNVNEIIKQFGNIISIDFIIFAIGSILFGFWLLKTSFGRKALLDSPARHNNMPSYLPFIPLLIWFGTVSPIISITNRYMPDLQDWQRAFLDNFILCIGTIAATVIIIFLARASFTQRLKGFGLNPKTIVKDFLVGLVNLLSVWPVIMAMIVLTLIFGQLFRGPDFLIEQHEELKTITAHRQLPLRVLIVVTTVVVAPVFEEMLFRGLFQTMIRSHLVTPWLPIAISSAIFATMHQNWGHWPALFVLGMCLGYSYEKSGSLFRPIFIHSLFNAATVTSVLYSV
jgi:membrane protease YdiL (CAAX protease family)